MFPSPTPKCKVLYQPEEDSLAGITTTQMEYRQTVQRNLERRIEEMLQPLFGSGRVIALRSMPIWISARNHTPRTF